MHVSLPCHGLPRTITHFEAHRLLVFVERVVVVILGLDFRSFLRRLAAHATNNVDALRPLSRGLHSSTFQLRLSRF